MESGNNFVIDLPDGWEDRTVYSYMGPDDSGVQHILTLTIDRQAGGTTLKEYARDRIDQVVNSLQSLEILKEEEKTLPNGNSAYECVYKWIPVKDKIIFQKLVYMILDGVGYTFSANFSKKTIKTIGAEVDQIINSFHPGNDVDTDEDE